MSTLDLSKVKNLALKKGIYDEYYKYIRFSDFKGGFNGFISRLIQDFEEMGLTVSEEKIVEEVLPTSRLIVEAFYEGGFADEITKNARKKVRGDITIIAVEKLIFLIFALRMILPTINKYINHKLNMKKLKEYVKFFKNEVGMSDDQLGEFLVEIIEIIEKKDENFNLNLANILDYLIKIIK